MICVLILCFVATAFGQATVPCGVPTVQPITSRIVGGVVAKAGSWPWLVLLTDSLDFIAGSGVVINPHVILTSAQHFEGAGHEPQMSFENSVDTDERAHRGAFSSEPGYTVADLDLKFWRAYAGEYDINVDDPHEAFYHIRRVVLHPGYNITSLENDIALIITKEPIQWNNHTRPACIPDATHTYTPGETCYLPGWGSTSGTGNEEVLNQLAMPIIADSVCQTHWTDFLPSTELCAGYENQGKDFCGDDIGSPLMCKDQNGAWYAQGLASSGGDCQKADEPGIFEDVTQYSDWIKKTMSDAGYPYAY